MIFESLYESARAGELILVEGGYCRWHLCRQGKRAGQITIYEIISLRPGAGKAMLDKLKAERPRSIFAKCPADLPANAWYRRRGFVLESVETTKTGRVVNSWRLVL